MRPLPETADGNKYVLVVVDYFTRWTEAYGIPNQEAATVAKMKCFAVSHHQSNCIRIREDNLNRT